MPKMMAMLISALTGYIAVSSSLQANAAPYTFHPATYQDCDDDADEECVEKENAQRSRYRYRFNDEEENPAYKLERESAWPAEREEFSDYLFKD